MLGKYSELRVMVEVTKCNRSARKEDLAGEILWPSLPTDF
jgi:hypothetical protein